MSWWTGWRQYCQGGAGLWRPLPVWRLTLVLSPWRRWELHDTLYAPSSHRSRRRHGTPSCSHNLRSTQGKGVYGDLGLILICNTSWNLCVQVRYSCVLSYLFVCLFLVTSSRGWPCVKGFYLPLFIHYILVHCSLLTPTEFIIVTEGDRSVPICFSSLTSSLHIPVLSISLNSLSLFWKEGFMFAQVMLSYLMAACHLYCYVELLC